MGTHVTRGISKWSIVITGALSLAVAMGIGRFAFTPLLPMMLKDGVIDLASGSRLATANYAGYLVGALFSTWLPLVQKARSTFSDSFIIRWGLLGTAITTAATAVSPVEAWLFLRFIAGVLSAVVFISTATLCVSSFHGKEPTSLGSVVYAGPGLGIVVTSVMASAMIDSGFSGAQGWAIFALVAVGLIVPVWRAVPLFPVHTNATLVPRSEPRRSSWVRIGVFILAYGVYGFGYIVFATFLPIIARQMIGGEALADLFWAVFGAAAALGAFVTILIPDNWNRGALMAASYALQAIGIGMVIAVSTTSSFLVGSFAVGLPFTAMVFFAVQEANRLLPQHSSSLIAALTASFAIGQLCGPIMASMIISRLGGTPGSFQLMLEIAVGSLVLGIILFLCGIQRHTYK